MHRPWRRLAADLRALGALLVLAAVVHAQSSPLGSGPLRARQVEAPAADVVAGLVALPDPAALARRSRTALLPITFAVGADGTGRAELRFDVAVAGEVALVPLAPEAERWTLSIARPDQAPQRLDALLATGLARAQSGPLEQLAPGHVAVRYDVRADRAGSWRVLAELPRAAAVLGSRLHADVHGMLLVADGAPARLVSHLTDLRLVNDRPIGIAARLEGDGVALVAAELHARTAAGAFVLPLRDDGASADGAAGDGTYGVQLAALPAGAVHAQIVARGVTSDGLSFVRTAQHGFPVLERAALLTGAARTEVVGATHLALDVELWPFGAPRKLLLAAEVWGTDAGGHRAPAAWLARMITHDDGSGAAHGRLLLDGRRLLEAGVGAPLELRAVRLSDPDTSIPLDVLERIELGAVELPPEVASAALPGGPFAPVGGAPVATEPPGAHGAPEPGPPDVQGPRAGIVSPPPGRPEPLDPGLLLSHGYCSGGGIWPEADFTEPKRQFVDPDENRSHDEFAQLLATSGSTEFDSFGVIAHSQGGCAALHLLTFYESGLDLASGGRRIQAVATPWQGSPLAAELADIAALIGIGCGSNFDLSGDGAALWLASIPSGPRAEVHFWTTQNSGSACQFLTNIFLSQPNDGVVEMAKGVLPGGNNRGHVVGWCHSTGMSNPANYLDHARNAEMDAQAAR